MQTKYKNWGIPGMLEAARHGVPNLLVKICRWCGGKYTTKNPALFAPLEHRRQARQKNLRGFCNGPCFARVRRLRRQLSFMEQKLAEPGCYVRYIFKGKNLTKPEMLGAMAAVRQELAAKKCLNDMGYES